MSDAARGTAEQGGQKLDMSVKVYPTQDSKNLLATATVTLGGCFAIRGIRILDSERGAFVSMPQRKNAQGEYKDICFPTTAEMRKELHSAVLGEYQRTMEQSFRFGHPQPKDSRGQTSHTGQGQDRGQGGALMESEVNTNAKSKEKRGRGTGRDCNGDRPADAPLRTAPL